MKTVEETKKTKEDQVELKNEVKENTANTPEGAIPDDAAEAVAGGMFAGYGGSPTTIKGGSVDPHYSGVHSDPTLTKDRR